MKLLNACNLEGINVSVMLKEAITMRVDPDYLMNKFIERMDVDVEFFSEMKKKGIEIKKIPLEKQDEYTIEEIAKVATKESGFLTKDDLVRLEQREDPSLINVNEIMKHMNSCKSDDCEIQDNFYKRIFSYEERSSLWLCLGN